MVMNEIKPNLPNAIHFMLSKMVTQTNFQFENIDNPPVLTESHLIIKYYSRTNK
jgi:hypothetical protein